MTGVEMALLAGVGLVAGWMNVMAGGGSMLTVPAMLLLGLPGAVANGTNRIAILAQNIVAAGTFFRHGFTELRLSLSLAAVAVPGAVIGALLGVKLSGRRFELVLAVIMLVVLVLMFAGSKSAPRAAPRGESVGRRRLIAGHLCMLGAGFWGGFIQIGVGFILMPILHRVLGLDLVRVNAHKVVIVLIYTVAALAVFASQLELVWTAGLALASGNALGGWLGAHTNIRKGETWIRATLFVVLALFIAKLLLN